MVIPRYELPKPAGTTGMSISHSPAHGDLQISVGATADPAIVIYRPDGSSYSGPDSFTITWQGAGGSLGDEQVDLTVEANTLPDPVLAKPVITMVGGENQEAARLFQLQYSGTLEGVRRIRLFRKEPSAYYYDEWWADDRGDHPNKQLWASELTPGATVVAQAESYYGTLGPESDPWTFNPTVPGDSATIINQGA